MEYQYNSFQERVNTSSVRYGVKSALGVAATIALLANPGYI